MYGCIDECVYCECLCCLWYVVDELFVDCVWLWTCCMWVWITAVSCVGDE